MSDGGKEEAKGRFEEMRGAERGLTGRVSVLGGEG